VLATVAGVGAALATALNQQPWNRVSVGPEVALAPLAVFGAVAGVGQALVLGPYLGRRAALSWALATALGASFTLVAVFGMHTLVSEVARGLAGVDPIYAPPPSAPAWRRALYVALGFSHAAEAGAWLGTLQWLVLRTRVRHAPVWIVASAVAAPLLVTPVGYAPWPAWFALPAAAAVVGSMVSGAIFAAATGAVLAWLLPGRLAPTRRARASAPVRARARSG
jgi:hypothetical protein